MVAAPKHAVFNFVGLATKKTYSVDAYLSDVAEGLARFDSGAGAGSATDTFWICPEPMVLFDVAFATGLTDTARLQVIRNSVPTGDFLDYAVYDDGIANRPRLAIPFKAGAKLSGIQKA